MLCSILHKILSRFIQRDLDGVSGGLPILRWDSAETGLYHNLLGYHYILVQSNHEV